MKNGALTKAIAGTAVALGIIGGVWAADSHFVPRETHRLEMAAMSKAIQSIVKSSQIQRTQDEVYFWLRMEMSYRERMAASPNDATLKQLQEAEDKRKDAERRLKEMQCK